MNRILSCIVPLVLLLGVGALIATRVGTTTSPATRFVHATITCDGVEVLRGGTSDDGQPDADEVWSYLHTLDFKPTDDFARLGEPAAGARWSIPGEPLKQGEPSTARVVVEIAYGGRLSLRELVLVPADASRSAWRLAPDEVERWFRHRWISRDQAAALRAPKRVK